MRFLSLTALLLAVAALASAQPQPQRPRQRPGQQNSMPSRLRSFLNGAMADMSDAYDRVRVGFTRTFSNGPGNRNNGPSFRNSAPVDPAVHTNEIAPARASDSGAPNAPAQGGFRRPVRQGGFMQRVEQLMGGVRNMFNSFGNRGRPGRRVQQFQGQPKQPQPQPQQQHDVGEFRPLHE